MQRVVNGLLYDTANATVVHMEEDTKRILYHTTNGNFFMFYPTGEIVPKTKESAQDYLGKITWKNISSCLVSHKRREKTA